MLSSRHRIPLFFKAIHYSHSPVNCYLRLSFCLLKFLTCYRCRVGLHVTVGSSKFINTKSRIMFMCIRFANLDRTTGSKATISTPIKLISPLSRLPTVITRLDLLTIFGFWIDWINCVEYSVGLRTTHLFFTKCQSVSIYFLQSFYADTRL